MTKQIFIETSNKETNEHNFVETLCGKLNIEGYKIICVGGRDNINNRQQDLHEENTQNIILFDADTNYQSRSQKIKGILNRLDAKADVFLFPNNKNRGCFEDLLSKIVVDEEPLKCFNAFINCLKGKNYLIPNIKAKMYSYITVKNKDIEKIKKGNWDFKNTDIWDLDSNYLDPLTDFLKK